MHDLSALERVRCRPDLVFKSPGLEGAMSAFSTLLGIMSTECIDGHSDRLTVTCFSDGAIRIEDWGRGIWLGAGDDDSIWKAKFCGYDHDAAFWDTDMTYSLFDKTPWQKADNQPRRAFTAADLCAVQCVCAYMDVTVHRDGLCQQLHFEKGQNVGGLRQQPSDAPAGTCVHFKLDDTVFTDTAIPFSQIAARVKALAMQCPSAVITAQQNSEAPKRTGCDLL